MQTAVVKQTMHGQMLLPLSKAIKCTMLSSGLIVTAYLYTQSKRVVTVIMFRHLPDIGMGLSVNQCASGLKKVAIKKT